MAKKRNPAFSRTYKHKVGAKRAACRVGGKVSKSGTGFRVRRR